MRIKPESFNMGLIFILIGASLQNIAWYFRLKNPTLMREFIMYFESDGARLFLDFNIMNYFFLTLAIILYLIFYLINKRRDALRGKHDE